MPKIDKIFTLEISPEQFLNSCSLFELKEIDLLIGSAIKRKEREQDQSDYVELSTRMIKLGLESGKHKCACENLDDIIPYFDMDADLFRCNICNQQFT